MIRRTPGAWTIALNPSPFNEKLDACDLGKVGIFLLNEVEGEQLTGEHDETRMLAALGQKFPHARIVLTLGEKGVLYHDEHEELSQPAFKVKAVDFTAAGDTFTGFFLAALVRGLSTREALRVAAKASAISVCRKGASSSVPDLGRGGKGAGENPAMIGCLRFSGQLRPNR